MKKKLLFILLCSLAIQLKAQEWGKNDSVPVFENGKQLAFPWLGGLDCPQFMAIELNGDGQKDLVVFDRLTEKVKTFLNKGSKGEIKYQYAPEFEQAFPKHLSAFLLSYDYNCDGKEDLFTYSTAGMRVFLNTSTDYAQGPHFSKVVEQLQSDFFNRYNSNLYTSPVDIPALVDMDGDGDMDILTFSVLSNYFDFYLNRSKEKYKSCDSLAFHNDGTCWGHITGSASNTLFLHQSCRKSTVPPTQQPDKNEHAGATLFCIDWDGNGTKDLVVGDLTFPSLVLGINGGTKDAADISAVIDSFPRNTKPIKISSFPMISELDINNDGKKDLIASPAAPGASQNINVAWYYQNRTPAGQKQLDFQFVKENFLQENMLDMGTSARPYFQDVNNDGLKDLLLGSAYINQGENLTDISALALYINKGSAANPSFDLVSKNISNLGQYQLSDLFPAYGDLDNDGDIDLLAGTGNGKLVYFNNDATKSSIPNWLPKPFSTDTIDVGSNAAPQLYDVDKDGKLDLLIGNKAGFVYYYHNFGSLSNPKFELKSKKFGQINMKTPGSVDGYAAPHMYQQDGKSILAVACQRGFASVFVNIDNNLDGAFALRDTALLQKMIGGYEDYGQKKLTVAVADINNDLVPDFVFGEPGGGPVLYTSKGGTGMANTPGIQNKIVVFPNPAQDMVNIKIDGIKSAEKVAFEVFMPDGRMIESGDLILNKEGLYSLSSSNFMQGSYIIKISTAAFKYAVPFLIIR